MVTAFRCAVILLGILGLSGGPAPAARAADATVSGSPVFTDVFVPSTDGFNTIRIPSIICTAKGTLVAFAEGRLNGKSDQAQNKIIAKRSTDNGASWTACQTLADDGGNSLNNPTAVIDQTTGRIFLIYQRIPAGMSEASKRITTGLDGPAIYRNFLVTSDDDGRTWTKPADITAATKHPAGATSIASGPGIGIQLQHGKYAGRLIFPFNEGPFYRWNNFAVYSDDHGKSWAVGQNAPGNMLGKRSQVNEVQMVELSDGSVMLNSRQFAGGKCRKVAVSQDGAETWSPIAEAPPLRDPSCMASILRYSFPDQAHPGIILYSGPDAAKRENGTVYLSRDDAQTWPIKRTLVPGSFWYSVLVRLPDGSIGDVYEDGVNIRFARFDLNWLTSTGSPLTNAPATSATSQPAAQPR